VLGGARRGGFRVSRPAADRITGKSLRAYFRCDEETFNGIVNDRTFPRGIGYVTGGVVRGLLVGLVVTIIALCFTHLHVEHLGTVLSAVLLSSIVFALAGFINAVFAKNFDQITFVPTFILTPLTYLGGVFYSIAMLPDWAQAVSRANPILYMVNAFRFGFLGHSDVDVGISFTIMVLATVALFGSCVWLLERGTGTRE